MIIEMPRAFNTVIQGPVQLRLEYFMWYPITSLGNLFQNLAVPTECFLIEIIFFQYPDNFLWRNLCPLALFVTAHPETWHLQENVPCLLCNYFWSVGRLWLDSPEPALPQAEQAHFLQPIFLSFNLWLPWWLSTRPSPIFQCLGDKNWTKLPSRVE